MNGSSQFQLSGVFDARATGADTSPSKSFRLSIRFTAEEHIRLERDAADMPLSAYVRSRLFDADQIAPRRRLQRPVKDRESLARVLAGLGQSHMANNLNKLAKMANSGSLPVCPETTHAIHEAYSAIQAMRQDLLHALGL